jgi:hypothetical protein
MAAFLVTFAWHPGQIASIPWRKSMWKPGGFYIHKDVVKTNGFPKKMIDKWWLFRIKVLLCRMYIWKLPKS